MLKGSFRNYSLSVFVFIFPLGYCVIDAYFCLNSINLQPLN